VSDEQRVTSPEPVCPNTDEIMIHINDGGAIIGGPLDGGRLAILIDQTGAVKGFALNGHMYEGTLLGEAWTHRDPLVCPRCKQSFRIVRLDAGALRICDTCRTGMSMPTPLIDHTPSPPTS
jgi:uncharacterized protein YbaR (Trm112 family)